jgi:hypothetical protein
MAKVLGLRGFSPNFAGFDGEDAGIQDSKGRPLVVGDVVKVLHKNGTGLHDFEDPEYPEYDSYNVYSVYRNYGSLYGGESGGQLQYCVSDLNERDAPRPVNGFVALFDYHMTEGEFSGDNHEFQMVDVDEIHDYKKVIREIESQK